MFCLFHEPKKNTLSKDRWTILKISNDLTERADIAGRKLEQEKFKNPKFDAGMVEPGERKIHNLV